MVLEMVLASINACFTILAIPLIAFASATSMECTAFV
jgi:hypothetical protein